MRRMLHVITCVMLLLGAADLAARDYVIEVVVFENRTTAGTVAGHSLYVPRIDGAIGLASQEAADAGFVPLRDELTMGDFVTAIRESGRYRLLDHFAWRQPGLDNDSARPILVNIGEALRLYIPENDQPFEKFIPASAQMPSEGGIPLNVSTVSGTLLVRLGRFLHLDTRLVYTDPQTGNSFRLDHSRKMRSHELHYIDNPRFGLLVRIVPVPE